jgi:hypothetical protein
MKISGSIYNIFNVSIMSQWYLAKEISNIHPQYLVETVGLRSRIDVDQVLEISSYSVRSLRKKTTLDFHFGSDAITVHLQTDKELLYSAQQDLFFPSKK